MPLPRHAFFRGRIVPYSDARVGVLTHGLNYGTGCFAGIRGYWNETEQELFVFRPQDHFRRFLESTRLLDMTLHPEEYTEGAPLRAIRGLSFVGTLLLASAVALLVRELVRTLTS